MAERDSRTLASRDDSVFSGDKIGFVVAKRHEESDK